MKTDFLVIGAGIAGLTFVIKIAERFPDKKVTVVTKKNESNTQYAQGGVAVVQQANDSFEKHVQDTLRAGDGLCNEEVVRMVIKEGPSCLQSMMSWGVNFDFNDNGNLDLGKEGGHSEKRVVHNKDITGAEISRGLIEKVRKLKNAKLISHHFVVDLISDDHLKKGRNNSSCYGAFILHEKKHEVVPILSEVTVLATGGLGQVYQTTTNPEVATGDGIAMAHRINASIKDIEFIQFHPTILYSSEPSQPFLISEAVRGFGAILRTKNGEKFMHKYDVREELASRDIVARAIDAELKISGDNFVFLDCTHLDKVEFSKRFPTIKKRCLSSGVDVHSDYIPVVPAAHYVCGGIEVDKNGQTAINNLFACGECSYTGLHGANRLASNSLLEAFVYADRCAEEATKLIDTIELPGEILGYTSSKNLDKVPLVLVSKNRKRLQEIMQISVGIVRSDEQLKNAQQKVLLIHDKVEKLYNTTHISPQLCELRNMVTIAQLIISYSLKRNVNCGGFYKA